MPRRIVYENGQFVAVHDDDQESENLIRYLGWNRPELATDRSNHVRRVRDVCSFFGEDVAGFVDYFPSGTIFRRTTTCLRPKSPMRSTSGRLP